jgi:hypothetical protein
VVDERTEIIAEAIYRAEGLYLSPSDSMKAAQAAIKAFKDEAGEVTALRNAAFRLPATQQYFLAYSIADNIGYDVKSRDPLALLSVGGHALAVTNGDRQ